jgi:chemotaxis protein CheD
MVKTRKIVDISDAQVSRNPADVLVTYSLGSCIGVTLYDPSAKVGGMLHYQLPESKLDPEKAKKNPFMFADTGMAILLNKCLAGGAKKNGLKVKLAGGAAMATGPKGFDIGKRNHLAIRKILWKNGLFIDGEDVGGSAPRNMYLHIDEGIVAIRSVGVETNL